MSLSKDAIIAFNDPWHDSSFCIYDDAGVRHFELERFTRRKFEYLSPVHAFCELLPDLIEQFQVIGVQEGTFLSPAIKACLSADYDPGAAETPIPIYDPLRGPTNDVLASDADSPKLRSFVTHIKRPDVDVFFCGHHASHAANAFFSSGFDKAVTITLDGGGYDYYLERTSANVTSKSNLLSDVSRTHQIYGSVYECGLSGCRPIHQVTAFSFGWAWYRVTNALGLSDGSEGTVMAMAALGNPRRFRTMFEQFPVWLPADYALSQQALNDLDAWRAALLREVKTDVDAYDVAAALQEATEIRVRDFLSQFLSGDTRNICLAGGTFLNCQLTGKISRWFPQIKKVFVPPAPYDGGISLGVAQLIQHDLLGITRGPRRHERAPFAMGDSYSRLQIVSAARSHGMSIKNATTSEFLTRIVDGEVFGLFIGAAESGRRALGHRSIVADPRRIEVRDKINAEIKHRQWYRPLAPMVLHEHLQNWFDCSADFESPYMSHAIPVKEGARQLIPAVVHLDGTARVQTVHRDLTPKVHDILAGWHAMTGVPVLVNTSFNDREPIVETPHDAICTLKRVKLDGIYFGDHDLMIDSGSDSTAS